MTQAAGQFGVAVEDLRDFQRDLGRASKKLPRVVSKVHREFAREVVADAKSAAGSLPGGRHFARLMTGSGTRTAAAVRYKASRHPAAMGWLFGSKQHRQFLAWVGNRHQAGMGDFGTRVHAIGPAIERNAPRIADQFWDRVLRALAAAYPKGI